jgi:hypothetical protein
VSFHSGEAADSGLLDFGNALYKHSSFELTSSGLQIGDSIEVAGRGAAMTLDIVTSYSSSSGNEIANNANSTLLRIRPL